MSDATPTPRHERGLARDAGLNLVARLLAMACSSVTALLVANALTESQYGAYAVVFGINVVLVMALDLGLTSSLARYVAQGRATTRLVVVVAAARFAIVGVAALVVLAAPVVGRVDRSALAPLMPMLALLIVAQSLIAFQFGALPSLRRIRLLLAVTVAQPVGELALVLVARAQGAGAAGMLLATASSALVVSVVAWIVLLAPGRAASPDVPHAPESEHATLRMVAEYGRRIFLVSLLIAVIGQVDQFVIGAFHPLAVVAPYALAIKLQALVAAPAITIASIVAPRIAGAGAGALRLYRQWLAFLVVLIVGEVATICVLAPEAFGAISHQYRDDWPLLVAMAPFLVLSALAPLPSITLNQTGHASSRLRIAAATAAINIVLDLALVPWLSGYGAAIGTSVAFAYYLVRHHRLVESSLAEQVGDDAPVPSIGPLVARGMGMAAFAAGLAAAIAWGLDEVLDDPRDLLVLLVAGTAAAAVHVTWCSRIVRRPLT